MKTLLTTAAMAVSIAVSCTTSQAGCEGCDVQPLAVQQEPEENRSTLFDRSYFTHKPHSDERVVQYMPEQPAYRTEGFYERSAFRYTQSTIGRGRNADRLNVVETWGRGAEIRPYGEWERPFRRGAQPIWMTDPQAYFYGSYPYPFLSENRDHINFNNRTRRGGKRDFKDHHGSSKHGGKDSHGKGSYGNHSGKHGKQPMHKGHDQGGGKHGGPQHKGGGH